MSEPMFNMLCAGWCLAFGFVGVMDRRRLVSILGIAFGALNLWLALK